MRLGFVELELRFFKQPELKHLQVIKLLVKKINIPICLYRWMLLG